MGQRVELDPQPYFFLHPAVGMVAHITRLLEGGGVNIAYMDVDRKGRGGDAITVVESDEAVPLELIKHIESLPSVHRVVFADLTTEEEAAS